MPDGGAKDATKIDLLGEFRKFDKGNEQGEVLPENETLNSMRIKYFLENHGFTADNFNDRFKVDTALDMLSLKPTRGETEMAGLIKNGRDYLNQMGLNDLMERKDEASFNSTLRKELLARNIQEKEADLMKSYLAFHTIRKLCERTLVLKKQMQEQMEKEKTELGPGLKDQVVGVLKDVGKNFMDLSLGEKALAVGGVLALGVWLAKSENDTVKGLREGVWDVVKWGGIAVGGGFLANTLFKVATGKSAIDSISSWVGNSAGKQDFWEKTFHVESEKGDIIRKSVVYLGDKDFLDLAQRYREAKANGTKKIELPTVLSADMKPEEIFIACDVFFSRYPVEKLESKYRNFTPRPNWLDVVSVEMAEDGRFEYSGDLLDRTKNAVESGAIRSWNWIWAGEGFGVLRALYLKVNGKPAPSDEVVKGWALDQCKLYNNIEADRDLDDFCNKNFDAATGTLYKKALNSGESINQFPDIKFVQEGSNIYLVSRTKILNVADAQKSIPDAILLAHQNGLSFLNSRFPDKAATIPTAEKIEAGVRVKNNSSYVMFMRMPL